MKIVAEHFDSVFFGTVETPKIKKRRFLKKLIELELGKKTDIPKPFSLSFRIYETREEKIISSVCVVKREEIDKILEEAPDVEVILPKEALFLNLCDEFPSFWGILCTQEELSFVLVDKSALIYGTRLPVVGSEDVLVDSINSVLRYAVSLTGQMPDVLLADVGCEDLLIGIKEKLLIPIKFVVLEGLYSESLLDYNLIPDDVVEERRRRKWEKLLIRLNAGFSLMGLLFCAFFGWKYFQIKVQVDKNYAKLEREYKVYKQIVDMRKELDRKLSLLKYKQSFNKLKIAFDVINLAVNPGWEFSSVRVGKEVIIRGKMKGRTKHEKYLKFLSFVSKVSEFFNVKSQSFDPEKGEFSLIISILESER